MQEQSWHTCRYARGNLHPAIAEPLRTNPEAKLLKAIFQQKESGWERSLVERGTNQHYFCRNPFMIRLAKQGIFNYEAMLNKKGKFTPYAHLFSLNLSGYYEGASGEDPFDAETGTLEADIMRGLRACANCRYYKKTQT